MKVRAHSWRSANPSSPPAPRFDRIPFSDFPDEGRGCYPPLNDRRARVEPNSTRPTTSKRAVFISTCCEAVCTSRQHRSIGHEVCAELTRPHLRPRSTACSASFAAVTTASRKCARSARLKVSPASPLRQTSSLTLIEVGARRVQQTFCLRELGLRDWTLAQQRPRRDRHFGLRDFVQRVERVPRGAEHHRDERARHLQLQWNIGEGPPLPGRLRIEPIEGEVIGNENVLKDAVVAAGATHPGGRPGIENLRVVDWKESGAQGRDPSTNCGAPSRRTSAAAIR